MLSDDTVLRTPNGDRAVGSLRTGDRVLDQDNQAVEITVGASSILVDPHKVLYYPWQGNNGVQRTFNTYTVDGDNTLFMKATQAVMPSLNPLPNDVRLGRPGSRRLLWHTRCNAWLPPRREARAELGDLSSPFTSPPPSPTPRQGASRGYLLRPSTTGPTPNDHDEDTSSSDDDTFLPDIGQHNNAEQPARVANDSDEDVPPPPSSEAWLADAQDARDTIAKIQRRLRDDACNCGGTRTFQISCKSPAEAQHLYNAIIDPALAQTVDPNAVMVGETVCLSAKQFFDAPNTHVPNPGSGSPASFPDLKMTRFPFEILPVGSQDDDNLPVDAWWLGFWTGDGTHNATSVTTADPEIRQRIHQLVDDINATRPAGKAPLHVREYLNQRGPHSVQDVWQVHISSTVAGASPAWWNPFRTGLQQLDIFANDKRNGIPEVYQRASEHARAALLAGLMDSDGCANQQQAGYKFVQIDSHLRIVEDTRRLASGLGLRIGRLHFSERDHSLRPGVLLPAWGFEMYGPNLAKVQPYIVLQRKKLTAHWYNKDDHAIRVEKVREQVIGRRVSAQGRETLRLQLRDGYIIQSD